MSSADPALKRVVGQQAASKRATNPVLGLVSGAACDMQKVALVAVPVPTISLGDVRSDRVGRPHQLYAG